MSAIPPAFEEASACNGCKKAFGLLKRRHHCRNCGKSFCGDCQTKTMPLPAFGLTDPQRVCEPCAAQLTATPKAKAPVSPPTSNPKPAAAAAGGAVAAGMSTPAMRAGGGAAAAADKKEAPVAAAAPAKAPPKRVKQCKCNMPLCICPDDPAEKEADAKQNPPAAAAVQNKPAPKPAAASGAGGGNSTFFAAPKQSGFSGFGQKTAGEYDLHGDLNEQCREAIKANDLAGVTKLLKAGASATYRDRTGATLLHMAAMFDRQAMVSLLVKAGADISAKNAHGETPIDLAPPSLGAKMAARKFDA